MSASMSLIGTTAAAPSAPAAVTLADTSAATCAELTGLSLPGLPRSDTATVDANYVSGSGCQALRIPRIRVAGSRG
jgi:hypothetical protein